MYIAENAEEIVLDADANQDYVTECRSTENIAANEYEHAEVRADGFELRPISMNNDEY